MKMNKKAEIVLIISGIISILVSIFLVIYYKLIIKNHTGMMDWWAIIMLVIPLVVLCVARIIIEFTPIMVVENNIIKKIIMTISELLLLPIMLIYFVALFIPSLWSVNKKTFKKLIDKGFTYKYKNKVYTLKRKNIEIQILANLEDYYISFDSGENFVRIEESNLGFQYNRDELKFRLHEYITAPSLYKQKGDVVPPVSYFVDFLNNFKYALQKV